MHKRSWLLLVIFWLMTLVAVNQYCFCPRYNFNPPVPFTGNQIYNPYEGADFSGWVKCNFHSHTNAWYGFTNGKATAEIAFETYDLLEYGVHCISNYQTIDPFGSEQAGYIEAYEHGYGLLKNHQTILGHSKVLWKDYLLPQTIYNKQHILSSFQNNDSTLLIINHPALRNSYAPFNFNFLSGYDCIEIFPSGSFNAWDAALSAGRTVFAVANDDAHNLSDPAQIGRNCTWVGISELNEKNVLQALRKGKNYIMVIAFQAGESFSEKRDRIHRGLPSVRAVTMFHDTLVVTVSDSAGFKFTGQGGQVLSKQDKTTKALYVLQPDDAYVRTGIYFKDGSEIDLNPIIRYTGILALNSTPSIDASGSFWSKVLGVILLTIAVLFTLFISRKFK